MNKIIKAIKYSAFGQYSVHIINFTMVVVLARLLTPAEIGVFAIASSVYLIATELRSMGVVQFLIREQEIDESKIRSALGITILVSWGLGIITIVSAPWIAAFYNHTALVEILLILSVSFFIGPFTSIPNALWMRDMRFKPQFYLRFSGALVTLVSAIWLILLGYSYYGLAIASVLGLAAELLIAVLLRPKGTVWIPSFKWMGDLVRFGLYTTANNLFFRIALSIPDLVIGRIGTMADVGIFSRGAGIILFMGKLIFSAVGPVVLPHLSKVNREGESVADAYLRAINLQAAVSWPILAVVSVAALPMIRALFGDQWDQAAPIASILAYAFIIQTVHHFANAALLTIGAEKLVFINGLIVLIVRLAGVIIAVPFGLRAAAWAVVFSSLVDFVLKTTAIRLKLGVGIRDIVSQFGPNAFMTLGCWLVAFGIDTLMQFEEANAWLSILVLGLLLPPTWLFLLRLTNHELWKLVLGQLKKRL